MKRRIIEKDIAVDLNFSKKKLIISVWKIINPRPEGGNRFEPIDTKEIDLKK